MEKEKPSGGWRNPAIVVALITAGATLLAAFLTPLTQYFLTVSSDNRSVRASSEFGELGVAQPGLDNTNINRSETQVTETGQQEEEMPPKGPSSVNPIELQPDHMLPKTDVTSTELSSPEISDVGTSSRPKEERLDLGQGETVEITSDGIPFSMLGTPYTGRSDLVGVRINGQTESLRAGETYNIREVDNDCEISLLEIDQSAGRAKFRVRCNS